MKSYKAGYEYLLAYKITVPIYDYTVKFVDKYISKFSRTCDQMVQAARSGMQNISEGHKQEGLKGYIKLSGVAPWKFGRAFKRLRGLCETTPNTDMGKGKKQKGNKGDRGNMGDNQKKSHVARFPQFPLSPQSPRFCR